MSEQNTTETGYKKAIAILSSAEWGECSCYKCVKDRTELIKFDAFKVVYPKLPIMPHRFAGRSTYDVISLLNHIRQKNNTISDNFDSKAEQSGKKRPSLSYCRNCGVLHRPLQHNGIEPMCPSCTDSMRTCGHCGKNAEKRAMSKAKINDKSVRICSNCKKEFYFCNICGYLYYHKDTVSYDARRFEDGSMEIYHCCLLCDKNGSFICNRCGEKSHNSVSRESNNGDYLCPACVEEDQGMMPYYFKPMRLHFNKSKTEGTVTSAGFYLGFEIEIAQKRSTIDQSGLTHLLKEKFGKDRLYCMHDGTIESSTGYSGLEVVSHPFTWQDYKDRSYKWDEMLIFLRNSGWKANLPGVGFHIHTNKSAWGSFQIYKLLQLVYKNKSWICSIAQRQPTTYCTMSNKDFDEAVLVAKDKKNRKPDHYAAINLNNGNGSASNTIEFRMFQGSLEPLYFHKNIEFVRACFQYTHNFRDMSTGGFTAYVNKNNREFPCLNEFFTIMKGI